MVYKYFLKCLLVTAQVIAINALDELIKTSNVKLEQKLDSTESLIAVLAEEVCLDLEIYQYEHEPVSFDTCVKNFLESNVLMKSNPPTVQFKCLTAPSVAYSVKEAEDAWTLVVLAPDNTTVLNLPYDILQDSTGMGRIEMVTPGLYRTWSTALYYNGSHSAWRRGPDILSWNHTGEIRQRNYAIQTDMFHEPVNNISKIEASFSWNHFDEEDACFHFVNYCNGQAHLMIGTHILPNMKNTMTVRELPLDTECEVQLTGKYGTTHYKYRTPHCRDLSDCIEFEKVQNLTLEAEEGEDGWTVVAAWSRPGADPLHYNVTLFAEHLVRSLLVPGNETSATFTGVDDEGYYDVAEGAAKGPWTVYTSARAAFPASGGVRALGSPLGAWWALPALAAAAAATALLWRQCRRNSPPSIDFPDPEDKLPKDGISEIVDLESTAAEDHWELRSERLLLHEVIGEGAFGVVRRGTLAPAGKEVAVKMLKDFPTLDEVRSFRAEMELMKSVGAHPHIVSLVGCCSGRRPLIVAEYCGRGDLLSYLRCSWDVMVSKRNVKYYNNNIESSDYRNDLFKCKAQGEHSKLVVNKLYDLQGICDTDLTTRDLLSFCRQIAMGMEFLASNRLVHRDLAARNVLVANDRTLKIADFGLSRDVYEENQYKQKGNGKMPMKWMALESLTHRIYTTQSDVWSFGVVMWEVASVGASPYAGVAGARLPRLLRAGYRMPRPAHCPQPLYELMLQCWRAHPRERPTFGELHARLDELLNRACAGHYLRLDLDDRPPLPAHTYVRRIIRSKLGWSRGESYERPLRAVNTNHYSSPPASLARTPVS